ncbi:MAG: PIN domain-containing protein [Anaerolineaceae bacterium]|nr:PIN domain-containing protein [Anaerolineae bacterium]MCB9079595.1 PIN domain-containing protein [Anaerolineaceae bacterium]
MSEAEQTATLCFVDTNIWLYGFIDSQDSLKHETAKRIIQGHDLVISTQVINEVCVNLLRKGNFPESEIETLIAAFYSNYSVIDFSQEILINASRIRQIYSLSYWDSLIVTTALSAGCEILYSEDMHDGLYVSDTLTIKNPFKP